MAISADGFVYVSTNVGVEAFRISDGAPVWSATTRGPGAPIIAHGALVITGAFGVQTFAP
jgi:hypothetical protein